MYKCQHWKIENITDRNKEGLDRVRGIFCLWVGKTPYCYTFHIYYVGQKQSQPAFVELNRLSIYYLSLEYVRRQTSLHLRILSLREMQANASCGDSFVNSQPLLASPLKATSFFSTSIGVSVYALFC